MLFFLYSPEYTGVDFTGGNGFVRLWFGSPSPFLRGSVSCPMSARLRSCTCSPGTLTSVGVGFPEVLHHGRHELRKRPWPPQGGRGEMAMAWPGCMLHQVMSLSSVPVKFPVHGAASHNRWGVVERRLPAKTQGRTVDSFFNELACCPEVSLRIRPVGWEVRWPYVT